MVEMLTPAVLIALIQCVASILGIILSAVVKKCTDEGKVLKDKVHKLELDLARLDESQTHDSERISKLEDKIYDN